MRHPRERYDIYVYVEMYVHWMTDCQLHNTTYISDVQILPHPQRVTSESYVTMRIGNLIYAKNDKLLFNCHDSEVAVTAIGAAIWNSVPTWGRTAPDCQQVPNRCQASLDG